jgi:hypothetical protein
MTEITINVEALTAIIRSELAAVRTLDAAMPGERNPGYVMLMRSSKMGKQASIEQLTAMLRMAGIAQPPPPPHIPPIRPRPLLRMLHATQSAIVALYEPLVGTMAGAFELGFAKCWRRARKQLAILDTHRGGELQHVCFRCLLDRPAPLPPLERSDPHPYTYVCSACHQETLGDMPPDLARTEDRIIEHALGRPSILKAEESVHAKLAGLAPGLPRRPIPRKTAYDTSRKPRRRVPKAVAEINVAGMSEAERAYVEMLFDYRSVAEWW